MNNIACCSPSYNIVSGAASFFVVLKKHSITFATFKY